MYFCFGTLNYFNYINVMINYPRFMFFNDEWNKKNIETDKTIETGMERRSSNSYSNKEQKKV